jgi:hypothetical protein
VRVTQGPRQRLADVVVESDFARFDLLHEGKRDELGRRPAQPENAIVGHRLFRKRRDDGVAIRLGPHHLSVFDHGGLNAWHAHASEHVLYERIDILGLARRVRQFGVGAWSGVRAAGAAESCEAE